MKKRTKQNLVICAMIGILSICILILFSFMMPPLPQPVVSPISEEETTNESVEQDKKGLVVIDPGHGGYDDGAMSESGVLEKDLTLTISLKVKALLEQQGVEVILTRENDDVTWSDNNVKDLQARLDIATNAQADLMVSLHCNLSDEDPENVSGSEVYANSKQKESTELAQSITDELSKLSLRSRGIKTGRLHLLTYNTLPTVIVEMGFLSNPKDVEFLTNESSQNLLCEKIAAGILHQLN